MVDTQQPAALAIICIFLGLSTLFMILRGCARVMAWKEDRKWDSYLIWSDALLFVAYVLMAGESYVIMRYTLYTWQGYHVADIPKLSIERQIIGQKYNLANQLVYNPILAFVKASIIFFLLRIGDAKPIARIALWTAQIINLLLGISIFFADAFQCSPFRYVYDYPAMDKAAQEAAGADKNGMVDGVLIKGGTCINQINFFLISAGLAVGTDLLVVAIPTVIVWDLKMPKRRKIIAAAILSTGVIVTAVSAVRLAVYHWRFSPHNKDRTYGVGYTVSNMEANLAIVAGSIPGLGPLIRRVFPTMLGTADRSRPSASRYLQSAESNNEYALRTRAVGWKGARNWTEAWSSHENILTRPDEIQRSVRVDLQYGNKTILSNASSVD